MHGSSFCERPEPHHTPRRKLAFGGALATTALAAAALPAAASAHHGARPAQGTPPVAVGVVQGAPGASSFTVQTRRGATDTVDVSGSTDYVEHGVSPATLKNVEAGDLVVVFGTSSGSTLTATKVLIAAPWKKTTAQGFVLAGKVEGAPGTESFSVKTRSGTSYTVDVSSTTKYLERGVSQASLKNVASGDYVALFGTVSGSTVTALGVSICENPAQGTPKGKHGHTAHHHHHHHGHGFARFGHGQH